MHVEGELSVQHITAPVEIQETEPVVLYGELVAGTITGDHSHPDNAPDTISVTSSTPNIVKIYAHTHPFKNVPLKLMESKDDVRKVAKRTTDKEIRTAAIPVIHEKKTAETGPSS
jgi:hypothetical protein